MKNRNLLILFLIVAIVGACSSKSSTKNSVSNDPFSIFKNKNDFARATYMKKGEKEFLVLKGGHLRDYTVVSNSDNIELNINGSSFNKPEVNTKDSRLIKNIRMSPTVDGSRVDIKVNGKPGFKIYKRKSGLVLAMGRNYSEIADDDLDKLEAEVKGTEKTDTALDQLDAQTNKDKLLDDLGKDNELDSLLKDSKPTNKEVKKEVAKKSDKELGDLLDDSKNQKAKTDEAELDLEENKGNDLAVEEEEEAEEDLRKGTVIKGVEFLKLSDKNRLVIKTNKPCEYEKTSLSANNQVILDLKNTYLPKKYARPLDTSEFAGPVTMISPYQIKGPYKNVRFVIQLRNNVEPEISQENENLHVDFSIDDGSSSASSEEDLAISESETEEMTSTETNDIEAAKKLNRMNFEDYLARPAKFYGSRMTIEFADAEIYDVLKLIQNFSGINIVVSEGVKGKVNISLKNVPWDQALSVILQNAQLGYVRQGSVIRVAPLEDMKKERELAAQALDAQRNLEPLKVLVMKMNYINSENILDRITPLLSQRGKASVDPQTNIVVVHDIEDVIVKVNRIIKEMDKRPYQIAIEAKIIEANESWIKSIGFDWATSGGEIVFKNLSGYGDLNSIIGAGSISGDVRIISAPRISTLDRRTASIIQGTQVSYKTSTVASNGATIDKIAFTDFEVALTVTPSVTSSDEILMNLDVKREFPDYSLRESKKLPPGVGVRRANSGILLKNGDTAVIGGLYAMDSGEADAGVPFLGKIPIIGWFFGKGEKRNMKTELFIFIKASVINNNNSQLKS